MRDLCCSYLLSENYDNNKVFVDCTLGGGGHTKAILEKGCKVIAIDQDYDSIKLVSNKLSNYVEQNQLEIINTNFRNIKSAVANSKLSDNGLVDGILMDLGISSHQIDVPERGKYF
jgi:16S rRNA (cytosine1402-N4)-methyltransferase